MELEWVVGEPRDSEDQQFTVHYLINPKTAQCYACIAEPRKGHRLYETDIRVRGYDRSYVTLEAAKSYAEFVAMTYEAEECADLEKAVKQIDPMPEPIPVVEPVKRGWWK